tara:strand:+ start:39 stop:482 length:444 start_codon:yes stop_codon:yes gene_type:complete
MVLESICSPALIYLIFSTTQIIIDTVKGMYNLAFMKFWVTIIFTLLLNTLCQRGLGVISWFIVFIPFILMTVVVSMLLLMFGLDPITGRKPKVLVKDIDSSNINNGKKREIPHPRMIPKSHISKEQGDVLQQMVQTRTKLQNDPLQK